MDKAANTNTEPQDPNGPQAMPAPEVPPTLQQVLAQNVQERMQQTVGAMFRQLNEQAALNQLLVADLKQKESNLQTLQGQLRLARDELSLARAEIAILRAPAAVPAAPVPSRNLNRKRK